MHATLCDLILDLVQNSIEARATEITLKIKESNSELNVLIEDNGKGMDAPTLQKTRDPFFTERNKHPHRKVGLGLPFLFQTVEMTKGTADIKSEKGVGTTIAFNFDLNHIDLPEFGDVAKTVVALMAYQFKGNLIITHQVKDNKYEINKKEIVDILGDLNNTESLLLLRQFVQENEDDLKQV